MITFGFGLGLLFSMIATPLVRGLARKWGVLDVPNQERKRHGSPVPLLGGIAILMALAAACFLMRDSLVGGFFLPKHLAGILLGAAVLAAGGAIDDKFNLKPVFSIISPVLAAGLVIASGIGIDVISNPFGGVMHLDLWNIPVATAGGLTYYLSLPGDALVFVWLLGMMYTTKLLDGLDGLVSGLTVIGLVVIALLALQPAFGQPELARFSMIAAGVFGGFLFYNARPASIFLGEGGSTLAGYLLGVVAIISGAKIGTALLVMAVPILDVAWTIFRRAILERKSFASADAGHFHHRLIGLGLTQGQAVAVFWAFAATFGAAALFVPRGWKVASFAIIAALFVAASYIQWKRSRKNP